MKIVRIQQSLRNNEASGGAVESVTYVIGSAMFLTVAAHQPPAVRRFQSQTADY